MKGLETFITGVYMESPSPMTVPDLSKYLSWSPLRESNSRPQSYQDCALTTVPKGRTSTAMYKAIIAGVLFFMQASVSVTYITGGFVASTTALYPNPYYRNDTIGFCLRLLPACTLLFKLGLVDVPHGSHFGEPRTCPLRI